MRTPTLVFSAAALLTCLFCFLAVIEAADVTTFTAQSLKEWRSDPEKQDKPLFVQFATPWCGLCKKLAPVWDELATAHQETVRFATFDCEADKEACDELSVRVYPTLLMFRAGKTNNNNNNMQPIQYSGVRNKESIEAFLKDHRSIAQPKIVLKYFGTRGRAELIRLVLAEAGLEYEEIKHNSDTWPEAKKQGIEDGSLPFGQMPALEYNGVHLVQSYAIAKFLGRHHGLYPVDPTPAGILNAAIVDMVLGAVEDIRTRYNKIVYSNEFDAKRQEYVENEAPQWLQYMEKLLQKRGTYFLDSNHLTIADLAVFDILNTHLQLSPSILDKLPALKAFHQRVREGPRIKAYLLSDKRPKNQNGLSAFWDNPNKPSTYDVASLLK